jgi:hypothetical protein
VDTKKLQSIQAEQNAAIASLKEDFAIAQQMKDIKTEINTELSEVENNV